MPFGKATQVSVQRPMSDQCNDFRCEDFARCKESMPSLSVGTAGFEPATPCTPSKCASRAALRSEIQFKIQNEKGKIGDGQSNITRGHYSRTHTNFTNNSSRNFLISI